MNRINLFPMINFPNSSTKDFRQCHYHVLGLHRSRQSCCISSENKEQYKPYYMTYQNWMLRNSHTIGTYQFAYQKMTMFSGFIYIYSKNNNIAMRCFWLWIQKLFSFYTFWEIISQTVIIKNVFKNGYYFAFFIIVKISKIQVLIVLIKYS